ncbi:hypothetical protein [Blastochloris tepida]|uniref:hypothetical protein n=1 Tax=Blastochloris tepida TaxID=2233851 RepID=UPI000F820182|nr:hypothetical protein [Blastochloris tepida]
MTSKTLLHLNATLKFIEFIIKNFDEADDTKPIGQIRQEFKEKLGANAPKLINQHFGIIRLIPLMHIAQEKFLDNTEDGKILRIIRNSFAHNDFQCNENVYKFFNNRPNEKDVDMEYEEFVNFIWRIENAFFKERYLDE